MNRDADRRLLNGRHVSLLNGRHVIYVTYAAFWLLTACSASEPTLPTLVAPALTIAITSSFPAATPTLPAPTEVLSTAVGHVSNVTPQLSTAVGHVSNVTPSPQLAVGGQPSAVIPSCSAPGRVVTGVYPSQIAGPERAYRVYLPPCYGEDGRAYPTLYMLHGNVGNDSVWDDLGLDEAAEAGIVAGTLPPLLIVMPDGGFIANDTSGGPFSFEGVILLDLIPFIEANYCAWADPAGRAIGGLSRGGYWALEIAFRYPLYFASVGGHSAALLDMAAGPDVNPQVTWQSADLTNLRIYFDIGQDDWVIANVQRLHNDMTAAAIPHTWMLNEGRHEDAYWSAHTADYLAWYTEPWPVDRTTYPACAIEEN